MGFWPHCVALMAASPSLGLKGDFSAERDHSFHWRPSPRLKSGANPSLVKALVDARRDRSRWRCPDLKVPTMVQVADTDSGVVRGIEVHLISTAWIKTCQFRVWSRRRQAVSAMFVK